MRFVIVFALALCCRLVVCDVDASCKYSMDTRPFKIIFSRESCGGSFFNVTAPVNTYVTSFQVKYEKFFKSIVVQNIGLPAQKFGITPESGSLKLFEFEENEYLVENVEFWMYKENPDFISYLKIKTNLREEGIGSKDFASEQPLIRMLPFEKNYLAGFFGRSGDYMDSLGMYLSDKPISAFGVCSNDTSLSTVSVPQLITGGSIFEKFDCLSRIKRIEVLAFYYSGKSLFHWIRTRTFSNVEFTIGTYVREGITKIHSYEFKDDEFITGEIKVGHGFWPYSNTDPNRVGYLSFSTTSGNTFSVGINPTKPEDLKTVFNCDRHCSIVGMFGRSGTDIDSLGIIVQKEEKMTVSLNNCTNTVSKSAYGSYSNPYSYQTANLSCSSTVKSIGFLGETNNDQQEILTDALAAFEGQDLQLQSPFNFSFGERISGSITVCSYSDSNGRRRILHVAFDTTFGQKFRFGSPQSASSCDKADVDNCFLNGLIKYMTSNSEQKVEFLQFIVSGCLSKPVSRIEIQNVKIDVDMLSLNDVKITTKDCILKNSNMITEKKYCNFRFATGEKYAFEFNEKFPNRVVLGDSSLIKLNTSIPKLSRNETNLFDLQFTSTDIEERSLQRNDRTTVSSRIASKVSPGAYRNCTVVWATAELSLLVPAEVVFHILASSTPVSFQASPRFTAVLGTYPIAECQDEK